jgi:hypothetical protein
LLDRPKGQHAALELGDDLVDGLVRINGPALSLLWSM